jgi:methyltransferase (TIGR00027 family)
LNWPTGTTIYEIDQPKVLEYKTTTLSARGLAPLATRRDVPADLRFDWPTMLQEHGFDAEEPTAWIAEGLLPFLSGKIQDRMFADIVVLSAPESRIAVENLDSTVRNGMQKQRARIVELGRGLGNDAVFDPGDLWYPEDNRCEPADWFATHGWQTQAIVAGDYLAKLGRPVASLSDEQPLFGSTFISAMNAPCPSSGGAQG